MKRRFPSIKALMMGCALCSTPQMAQADGVFLLQLGSFDNLGEAKARWSELKTKYPNLLSDFSARFQEVQLPPDNFIVYRTQAGALEEHTDAEIVCDQLSSRGDECYVVETAMFRPDVMADETPSLSIVNPVKQPKLAPQVPQMADAMPPIQSPVQMEVPSVPQPEFVDPNAPAATIGVVNEPKVTRRIINPAMKNPAGDVVAMPEIAELPAMDTPSVPTLGIMTPAPAAPVMSSQIPSAIAAPQFPAASAAPFDVMSAQAPTLEMPDTQVVEEEEGFWSWFNDPFGSDGEEVVDEIEYVEANQNDGSWFDALDPFSSSDEPDVDAIDFETERQMRATQAQVAQMPPRPVKPLDLGARPVHAMTPQTAAPTMSTPEMAAQPMMSPAQPQQPHPSQALTQALASLPPPEPADATAMEMVAQSRAAAAGRSRAMSMRPSATVRPATKPSLPADAPFAAKQVKGAPKTIMPPQAVQRVDAPPAIRAGEGGVEVSEAIRVPVTEGMPTPVVPQAAVALPRSAALKKLGTPSADAGGDQTLWAQIYNFGNQQTALAYWEAFRAENPTFPPVRVRVTQPYATRLGSAKRVSLRVGPFKRADMVTGLCAEVEESADIECKPVAEMGKSAIASFNRRDGFVGSRYEQQRSRKRLQTTEPMYWVQLGAYGSQGQADQQWKALTRRHKPLLDTVAPDVASPIMNSSTNPVYRLRTGPYAMRSGADKLCDSMRASGADCRVIFSR